MNTPESIVVSLDWAKKLKEAGWLQNETMFLLEADGLNAKLIRSAEGATRATSPFSYFSAPTAEEILRRLPKICVIQKERVELCCHWSITRQPGVFYHTFDGGHASEEIVECCEETLANAAAAMYCYLDSNNLLPKA